VVTKPFVFEGTRRMVAADDGVVELKEKVDALIVIPNQRLMDTIDKKMTLVEAFKIADSVLSNGVQGISDIITLPGLINRDFADVKSIMQDAGSAFMGIGIGVGENRASAAARSAVASPLLEISIDGAKGILFTITGGNDLTMAEVDEAAQIINEHASADCNIIFGTSIDEKMVDQIKITVIATGFDQSHLQLAKLVQPTPSIFGSGPAVPSQSFVNDQDSGKKGEKEIKREGEKVERKPEFSSETNGIPSKELGEEFEIPAFLRQGR